MSQTKSPCLLCPHCINSDHPLERNGLSWLKCPLCGENFRSGEIKGGSITRGHLSRFLQERLDINREVDSQMDNIVEESTDNLFHEIQMTKIFRRKAEKAEDKAIKTEIDSLFEVILGNA